MNSSTKKCEESCCLYSCTLHGRHHFHTERFTTERQRFVISNLNLRRSHKSNVWACKLSIDGKLRKTLMCSLFLCVCGWLLSDVVGGHYTNAKKQTQTVDIFRLIIVLVSVHVATRYLDSNFLFLYMF